jgi:hypothetical protein
MLIEELPSTNENNNFGTDLKSPESSNIKIETFSEHTKKEADVEPVKKTNVFSGPRLLLLFIVIV